MKRDKAKTGLVGAITLSGSDSILNLDKTTCPCAVFGASLRLIQANRLFAELFMPEPGNPATLVSGFKNWLRANGPDSGTAGLEGSGKPGLLFFGGKCYKALWLDAASPEAGSTKLLLLQELTAEMARLAAAKRALRKKNIFVATLNHEMRAPLSGIQAWAELLLTENLPGPAREKAASLYEACKHLLALVNDTLSLAQIEAGRLEIKPDTIHLQQLLETCLETVQALCVKKNITLQLRLGQGLPSRITADPLHLRQVLINLLSNAVKFTDTGSVVLDVSHRQEAPGRTIVDFSVRDSGPGMSPEQLRRIFRPFGQAHSGDRRLGGSGLGLMLSRRLLKLMKSDIKVTSTPGKGSSFSFGLEVQCPTETPADSAGALPRDNESTGTQLAGVIAGSPLLLIAEDEMLNQLLFQKLLHLEIPNARILTASNGRQAYDIFRQHRPDLVFLDVHMPEMNGLECARKIRCFEKTAFVSKATTIIALSGACMENEISQCLDAGMDNFMAKPLCTVTLRSLLARYLSEAKQLEA